MLSRSASTSMVRCMIARTRRLLAAIIIVLPVHAVAPASLEDLGPSFPCLPVPVDALARLTCSDHTLARADIRMVQTYYTLRQAVGPDGQKPLRSDFLSFVVNTRKACGLPPVEPGRDQSSVPLPTAAAGCVTVAYDRQRTIWARRLNGPAAEEAARTPEQNILLQSKLRDLGYLAKTRRSMVCSAPSRARLCWHGKTRRGGQQQGFSVMRMPRPLPVAQALRIRWPDCGTNPSRRPSIMGKR